ncbi:IS66 family insertion sequence element accessory protein TnpB, partial [Klebsiella pneumoniae]|uniref:IS66 family insertion sequence element accessory protein TnpB n=1 Tax=Klebsiella pneumoniae TaxID=573 RepID=UPI001F4BCDB8
MISLPSGTRIWLVAGATDMRKSFNGLGEQIHHVLDEDPFSGHLFPRFYVSTSKSIIKALINMHSFEIQLS